MIWLVNYRRRVNRGVECRRVEVELGGSVKKRVKGLIGEILCFVDWREGGLDVVELR